MTSLSASENAHVVGCHGAVVGVISRTDTHTTHTTFCLAYARFIIAAEPRLQNSFSAVDVRRTLIDFRRFGGRHCLRESGVPPSAAVLSLRYTKITITTATGARARGLKPTGIEPDDDRHSSQDYDAPATGNDRRAQ